MFAVLIVSWTAAGGCRRQRAPAAMQQLRFLWAAAAGHVGAAFLRASLPLLSGQLPFSAPASRCFRASHRRHIGAAVGHKIRCRANPALRPCMRSSKQTKQQHKNRASKSDIQPYVRARVPHTSNNTDVHHAQHQMSSKPSISKQQHKREANRPHNNTVTSLSP